MSSDMARMLAEAFCRTDLPTTFNPDAGISFTRPILGTWPTGTNLFTVAEATAMFEDILKFLPKATAAEGKAMTEDNPMTLAQAERLTMLAEECAEVIHAVTKILRHGYDNWHPDREGWTNRQQLEHELQNIGAVLAGMLLADDISIDTIDCIAAWRDKLMFTRHQHDSGSGRE